MAIENLKKHISCAFYFLYSFLTIYSQQKTRLLPPGPLPSVAALARRDECDDAPNSSVCARDGVLQLMQQALHAQTVHGSVATGPLSSAPLRRL
jgi:hypothetical protein